MTPILMKAGAQALVTMEREGSERTSLPSPPQQGDEPSDFRRSVQAEGGASGGGDAGAELDRHPGTREGKAACWARPRVGQSCFSLYAAGSRGVCVVSPPTPLGSPWPCVPLRGSAPSSVWYRFDPLRWRGACVLVEAGSGRRPPGATVELRVRHGRAWGACSVLVCWREGLLGASGTPGCAAPCRCALRAEDGLKAPLRSARREFCRGHPQR